MKLKKRKVVQYEAIDGIAGQQLKLVLECGHTLYKRNRGRGAPRRTNCDKCEIALDKARQQEGWFFAAKIQTTIRCAY